MQAVRKARAPQEHSTFPPLREAVLAFIESQVKAGELRESTAKSYRSRCRVWLFPKLGDVPLDRVTREQIGQAVRAIKEADRSSAIRRGIVNPVRMMYQHMIETKVLPGPNPAADLKWFIGRKREVATTGQVPFFTPDEASKVLEAMKALHPRWHAFTLTGFMAGLRWGEIAGLHRDDLERGVLTVQRAVSGGEAAPTKTGKVRRVKVSPVLQAALRTHMEAMALDAQASEWSAESRRLMFPTAAGNMVRYRYFTEMVWHPTLKAAKVVPRKFHATRHSYAAWLLSADADDGGGYFELERQRRDDVLAYFGLLPRFVGMGLGGQFRTPTRRGAPRGARRRPSHRGP